MIQSDDLTASIDLLHNLKLSFRHKPESRETGLEPLLWIPVFTGMTDYATNPMMPRANCTMKGMPNQILMCVLSTLCCAAVGCRPGEPPDFHDLFQPPAIYPDYTNTTIPPNIAPMNFDIQMEGDGFLTKIYGKKGRPIVVSGKRVTIPAAAWRDLLVKNQGEEITFLIYTQKDKQWQRYSPITNKVATDPIDGWITYRLIEPGYEIFSNIEINQRNLSSFTEKQFFNNEWTDKGQCANCHAFQNRRTTRMLFHTRLHKGGTIFIQDGKMKKVDLKTDATVSAGVYPSWHPDLNLVAFSVNRTSQFFHTVSKAKVEVLDGLSDLILYDVEANEITHILQSNNCLETFPHWSHDGNWLYYCAAQTASDTDELESMSDSFYEDPDLGIKTQMFHVLEHYDKIYYNLMRLPFDRATKQFGSPETVVDAASQEKSISFPRHSPDGRYVMYTLSDFGTFSIWHPESDLWIHDLATGENRPLVEVNSDAADSYHNWSSNGRWFVFTSRRDDGSYTRLYLAHFDESGVASKPFLLPQRIPTQNLDLMKSYNVPEFTIEPARMNFIRLLQTINRDAEKTIYRSRR